MPDHAWPAAFARSPADRDAVLVLSHLQGSTPRELLDVARREGSATATLAAMRRSGTPGDRRIAASVEPAAVGRSLRATGARLVCWGDASYPEPLAQLADPPGWLFVRGEDPSASALAVAVVGSRNCSPYGRDAATMVAGRIAAAGVAVVSGAARGVDAAAHSAALEVRGPTVAVLGSGIDMPYPRSSRGLIERIAAEGTVVSELPPGSRPEPRRFPQRNRIVAGLSRAVVVVEGVRGSGALITAEFAEQLDRPILGVPGPIDNPRSFAAHMLIREGAAIVTEPDDVLREIGVLPLTADAPIPDDVDPAEKVLLRSVSGAPATVDALARSAGLSPSAASVALCELELRGLVEESGGRYRRVPPPQKRRAAQTSVASDTTAAASSAEIG